MKDNLLTTVLKKGLASIVFLAILIPQIALASGGELIKGTITAKGIMKGGIVKAYQIVSAKSENGKFTGWNNLYGINLDLEKLTKEEINKLAKRDLKNGITLNYDEESKGYTSSVDPGLYLIKVEGVAGGDEYIYNPALVAVNIDDANKGSVVDGTVDFSGTLGNTAQLKRDKVTLDKKILDKDKLDFDSIVKEKGKEIPFEIATKIPHYSTDRNSYVFSVKDVLGMGFIKEHLNVSVRVNGVEIREGLSTFQLVNSKGVLNVSFNEEFIKKHFGEDISILYRAKLSGETVNFNPAKNTASIKYTNSYGELEGSKEDSSNQYTLNLLLKKIGEGSDEKFLEGAEFTVYDDESCKNVIQTKTSKKDGMVDIDFLGANKDGKEYYIKETKAPKGYTTNTNIYKITIKASDDEKNNLSSVNIKFEDVTSQKVISENVFTKETNSLDEGFNIGSIKNTKMVALPSTGGAGTYVVVGAGIVIIIFATYKYLKKKRSFDKNIDKED